MDMASPVAATSAPWRRTACTLLDDRGTTAYAVPAAAGTIARYTLFSAIAIYRRTLLQP